MATPIARVCGLTLAVALAFAPAPGLAVAPALLLLLRQMVQQTATSMIEDTLLSGLSGMGCKGIALANALAAFDRRSVEGGSPKLPVGGLPGLPEGGLPGFGVVPQMAGMPPQMLAKIDAMMPGAGSLPPGLAIDAEPLAKMSPLQQSLGQPLSVPQTLATIDELFELGFMPAAIQAEFKQCMVLVPATIPALGMGMGMLKPMIAQLRQARDELRALSPAEQDEVAEALAQEAKDLPADQRAALVEHLDSGFFPARVGQGVKSRLARR